MMALCPLSYEARSSVRYSQPDSFTRSLSCRSQYATNLPINTATTRHTPSSQMNTQTALWDKDCIGSENDEVNMTTNETASKKIIRHIMELENEPPVEAFQKIQTGQEYELLMLSIHGKKTNTG